MKRRRFIKKITAGAAALSSGALSILSGCKRGGGIKEEKEPGGVHGRAEQVKTHHWKMVTTWPPHFPVLGESAEKIAGWVEEMSCGRLKITVYGAGELVPALGAFDAVSEGTVEMGHGAAYYWAGKTPATQFFASVPFGLNAQSMNAWLYDGGGMELWEEVYRPYNLKPFVVGNSGVQMGGWFNKEINSMEDLRGLKMRIPGLGGKVLEKAGGSAVLVAGGDIYSHLEKNEIDATEWVGPYHDLAMGFYKAARYYYYPGWHEPGTALEMFVNLDAWNSLSDDLRKIVETAAYRSNIWTLSRFEAKNNGALHVLIDDHDVQLRRFPDSVLRKLKELSDEVMEEVVAGDEMSRRVYRSFSRFREDIHAWNSTTEEPYQYFKKL